MLGEEGSWRGTLWGRDIAGQGYSGSDGWDAPGDGHRWSSAPAGPWGRPARSPRFSPPRRPLTAVEALVLQQRAEDLALQGAEAAQPAQLLRQLRVGQRQVHPAAGTQRQGGQAAKI